MSGEKPGERARLFVALELPASVRGALERWRSAAIPRLSEIRAVPREAMHVTLCFLGWREVSQIEQIGAACEEAVQAHGPLRLSLGGPLWLPVRRPRVLALGVGDPSGALGVLQESISEALSAGGWYAPESRPFLGHVTVVRVGRAARVRGLSLPPQPDSPFEATAVTLFRSMLRPSGARYEPLRTAVLGGNRNTTGR